MSAKNADIIARLQRDILPLQGFKPALNNTIMDPGLGPLKYAFPNNKFPLGAVHEFICKTPEDASVTGGFIAALVSALMNKTGVALWINPYPMIFPPALKAFDIEPDKIIFIDLKKEKDLLWTFEEALKCEGLAAVVAEIPEIDFKESRRLQLAVEQSRVTGFILRRNPRNINTTACITRWKITSLASELPDHMPGVGFPRWQVELLKVRNGRPGSWQIEWKAGRFRHIQKLVALQPEEKKKTG